jgi:hyperosmotically inducible periplasmic protein
LNPMDESERHNSAETGSTAGGMAAGTKTGSATNGSAQSDPSLTQSVKDAFHKEGLIGQNKVVVETNNGVVTLTGTVATQSMGDRMIELAREVPGIRGVNVNLMLQDEKRPYRMTPGPDHAKTGADVDTDQENPHH